MDGVCLCVWDTDHYQIDNCCKCKDTEERKQHECSVPHHLWLLYQYLRDGGGTV